MNILILSDDFPPEVAGGAGVMAFRITEEYIKKGHQVLVVSATQDPANDILVKGITTVTGDNGVSIPIVYVYSEYHERWRSYVSLKNRKVLSKIEKIISDFKPDVVHAHNLHMHLSYASLRIAKKYAKKVFMTAHDIMAFYPGTFTEFIDPKNLSIPTQFDYRVTAPMMFSKFRLRYNPFRNVASRCALKKIDGVVAVSDALKDALVQNKIPVKAVIHNGIDISGWNISADEIAQFKKRFFVGGETLENKKLVLFQGRLSGAKGGDLILRAMQEIVQSNRDAVLLVVGKYDSYAERMKGRAIELGIEGNIVFTDWLGQHDVKVAYASTSVVVVPSVCFDSFPNGNLEAFVAGKPVVSTCFGGSREIVQDGVNGYVVNPFNIADMAEKIAELLNDQEKAKRFGQAGRGLLEKEFSMNKTADSYLELFS